MKKYSQNRGSTREGAVWQRSLEKFANVDSVLLWPRNIDDRPSTRGSLLRRFQTPTLYAFQIR